VAVVDRVRERDRLPEERRVVERLSIRVQVTLPPDGGWVNEKIDIVSPSLSSRCRAP
jgi:hypothetical protein